MANQNPKSNREAILALPSTPTNAPRVPVPIPPSTDTPTGHPGALLPHESPEAFHRLRVDIAQSYKPDSNFGAILTEMIAQNVWRTFRLAALDSINLETHTIEQAAELDQRYAHLTPESRTALALRDTAAAQQAALFDRLESSTYRRAMRTLNYANRRSGK